MKDLISLVYDSNSFKFGSVWASLLNIFCRLKELVLSGIRTRIFRLPGEYSNHLTNAASAFNSLPVERPRERVRTRTNWRGRFGRDRLRRLSRLPRLPESFRTRRSRFGTWRGSTVSGCRRSRRSCRCRHCCRRCRCRNSKLWLVRNFAGIFFRKCSTLSSTGAKISESEMENVQKKSWKEFLEIWFELKSRSNWVVPPMVLGFCKKQTHLWF